MERRPRLNSLHTLIVMYCVEVLTSGAQAKTKLTAHFDCLRQCVNDALNERLETLHLSVDNVIAESIAPLESCRQEIQQRVDVAVEILDIGE